MKILSWNLQGAGNPWTVRALKFIINNNSPDIFFLSETKLVVGEFNFICRSFFAYKSFIVDADGRKGGLALFWKNDLVVDISNHSHNHIAFHSHDPKVNLRWKGVGVYGWPETNLRNRTWGNLRDQKELDMFRLALEDCDIADLGYSGDAFTWSNNRKADQNVKVRLDRFCANLMWQDSYLNWRVIHLAKHRSDHSPIILNTEVETAKNLVKPFRFEQMWMTHEKFEEALLSVWDYGAVSGSRLMDQISSCGEGLKAWAYLNIGSVRFHLNKKLNALKVAQDSGSAPDLVEEALKIHSEVDELLAREEILWKQRSRADWLRDGDRNNKFFHRKASNRKKNNSIYRLKDDEGNWQEGVGLQKVITDYFSNLFSMSHPSNQEQVVNSINSGLSMNQVDMLNRPIIEEEIRLALRQMGPTKAPGPDGMPAIFYNSYWHIVGEDVVSCVLDVFNIGVMPERVNHTYITLIPKTANPETMKDFRPISLCNVVYKLIAKSAFVPGRLITDNALVAFEMIHSMDKCSQGKAGTVALKLDMSKAFDRVEWDFLRKLMIKMNFPVHFVHLIMACISSVTFSVLINGAPCGYIQPQRGLRKGDPISPYLFLICSEGFSTLLRQGERRGSLTGGRVCRGGPRINHLFFADDSMLFAKATARECQDLKNIISLYERASGQVVNYDKSEILFSSRVAAVNRREVQQILGMKEVVKFKKYLGMPTMVGRSKKPIFDFLKDRLHKRISGWKEKFLSKAGKEVLIKSIAQSIPTYIMSYFALPVTFCNEMQSIISRYWWSGSDDKRKISWVSWSTICKSKANGGLGFRNLRAFNLAMLDKQAWRLLQYPSSLCARVFRAKYFPSDDLCYAKAKRGSSYAWQSLIEGKKLLFSGLSWRLGNGQSIEIKKDNWVPSSPSLKPMGVMSVPENCKANFFIDEENATWNVQRLKEAFTAQDVDLILQIPLSDRLPPDKTFWPSNKNGIYSVRSGYFLALNGAGISSGNPSIRHNVDPWWKKIWQLSISGKVKHFLWRLCHGTLPCNLNLAKKGVGVQSLYPRCGIDEESDLHALKDCDQVRGLWLRSPLTTRVECTQASSFLDWKNAMFNSLRTEDLNSFVRAVGAFGMTGLSSQSDRRKDIRLGVTDVAGQVWTPPIHPSLKINTDVAISIERKMDVVSAVCRNSSGAVVRSGVVMLHGVVNAELAEAMAVRFGLKFAADLNAPVLELESDSATVIERLRMKTIAMDQTQLIVDDCLASISTRNVRFNHVRRSCNQVAHALAKSGIFFGRDCLFVGEIPFPVNELVTPII
ncbi:uncharacterized protein LOC126661625 [Mercurialis annua]|uniref:uncharacterized protein LOC126661625 n=1 Tax=Mercurialis annua TaxID=3986 RepID=UPI00215F566C|nr:uncharacterized protein LOC126661625 [Mercurialis annua]